jgi:hypothetical protein
MTSSMSGALPGNNWNGSVQLGDAAALIGMREFFIKTVQ